MRTTKTKLVEIIKEELSAAMNDRRMTPEGLLATIKDKLEQIDRTELRDSTGATAEALSSRLDYTAEAIDEVVAMIDEWEEEDMSDEYYL